MIHIFTYLIHNHIHAYFYAFYSFQLHLMVVIVYFCLYSLFIPILIMSLSFFKVINCYIQYEIQNYCFIKLIFIMHIVKKIVFL